LYTTPNVPSPSVSSLLYRVFFADDDDVMTTTTTTTTMAFCGDFIHKCVLFFEFSIFLNAKICSRRKSCTTRCSKDVEPRAGGTGTGTGTGEPVSVKRGGEVVRPRRRDGHASAQKNVIELS
jgi:hypothetical protein